MVRIALVRKRLISYRYVLLQHARQWFSIVVAAGGHGFRNQSDHSMRPTMPEICLIAGAHLNKEREDLFSPLHKYGFQGAEPSLLDQFACRAVSHLYYYLVYERPDSIGRSVKMLYERWNWAFPKTGRPFESETASFPSFLLVLTIVSTLSVSCAFCIYSYRAAIVAYHSTRVENGGVHRRKVVEI